MEIKWMQVLIAFFLGVILSATVKGVAGHLRGQASAALG